VIGRGSRRVVLFLAALAMVAALWELYKVVGPERGGDVLGWTILPRTDDRSMPHVWDMLDRAFQPEVRSSDRPLWLAVLVAAWYSFRLAFAGFLIGATVGLVLAIVMARFRFVERGLMPYLVASQVVPLIALAPLVATWGGRIEIAGWVWPRWLSASVLGAFLAFFPVAVGGLRGLKSTPHAAVELMDSYAASWRQSLWKLRLPAAVPHLVPALRLAAAASVIGVVVSEISTGLQGGVGRLIILYSQQATSDPTKLYSAIFGAAALGLTMAGMIAALDAWLMRNRPKEAATT
jgi:NitT/TauT family transport system permease protein